MPVRRIDALMGLMKAMKEEGHPQGLPGLHERVIGKVVLWGDGLGWACGEPHEAELGEDWDPPPPGGDCRRRLDGDSVNMRGGVASRCLWGCDISTVMWGHGTCCRWRSSPPHGAVRREDPEGSWALGWRDRIGSVCGQQPKPRPLVRAGHECGVRQERAQRNLSLRGHNGGDRAAREVRDGGGGKRMQAQGGHLQPMVCSQRRPDPLP